MACFANACIGYAEYLIDKGLGPAVGCTRTLYPNGTLLECVNADG
jgi:hypothetical protein